MLPDRRMRKSLVVLGWCLLAGFACTRDHEGLNKTATWEMPGASGMIEFYYLKGTLPEPALKEQVLAIAKTWSAEYERVQIFVFFDKGFAQKMDSESLEQKVFSGSQSLDQTILSDPELRVRGGAMLILSGENPEPQWYYQGPKPE